MDVEIGLVSSLELLLGKAFSRAFKRPFGKSPAYWRDG